MAGNRGFRAHLPDGIEIGQRFLLRFDDPRVEAGAYQGRLQDMSEIMSNVVDGGRLSTM